MRLRLILSFALIVLVSVGSVVMIARQNTASEVRAFMFRGGMTTSSELVQSLADYFMINGSWAGVENILHPAGSTSGRGQGGGAGMSGMGGMMNLRLRLADANGTVVADTSTALPEGDFSAEEKKSALPVKVDNQTVGYLLAQGGVGYTQSDEANLLNRLNTSALTAGLIAGGFSLLLALLLAYRLLRPVQALTRAAGKLAEGDLNQRVQIKGYDELAVLGRTFNHMALSLQQAQESRRALTADIAHELRTPLSVQRANLEALQDGIYPLTTDNLESILEQNLLLTRLVNDLRTLALAESGELQLEWTETDFVSLVDRVVDRFKPQADKQQVNLIIDHIKPYPSELKLDPMRIEQIINNLLTNALRHTPSQGSVVVQTQTKAGEVLMIVRDSGKGIPTEALPHVFERFYRADRSRNRAEGGSGLGLAIALNLAQLQGGNLTADNYPQGGAVFTLSLPVKAREKTRPLGKHSV